MRPIISVSISSTSSSSRSRLKCPTSKAEEIRNAPTVIPLSMGISTLLNGSLGFAMLLALLFCMPSDIHSIVNSETYYPFMGIYTYAVGSTSGATAMVRSRISCRGASSSLNTLCTCQTFCQTTQTVVYLISEQLLMTSCQRFPLTKRL